MGKLFDGLKKFYRHMFNIKLEEKSNKISFKVLLVRIQWSKNRQGHIVRPGADRVKRSKLRNIFNKKISSENWQNYKRQRNICSTILKSTKQGNLNMNETTDKKNFGKQ